MSKFMSVKNAQRAGLAGSVLFAAQALILGDVGTALQWLLPAFASSSALAPAAK